MFSSLASRFRAETNYLYKIRNQLESEGRETLDLISANVGDHGISFPQDVLEELLIEGARRSRRYQPHPLGRPEARAAIARFYEGAGIDVGEDQVLLTPGTSVAYWYCFKLLADEGEEILSPSPSYPLFDYIAALSGVRLISYPLVESRGWRIDLERLEASISTRTRAVILISPHNPTGYVADVEQTRELAEIARRHRLSIISDEVFSEFLLAADTLARPAATDAPLVFTLNGFSKMFALPGIKLGWMAVTGDADRVAEAVRTLEFISDTFLPVQEVVQATVPDFFERGGEFLQGYRRTILDRWQRARDLLAGGTRFAFVPPSGGFYVTLSLLDQIEDDVAERLLRRSGLLVHPGYFYDMKPNHLVLSFIQKSEQMVPAFEALVQTIEEADQNPTGGESAPSG